MNDLFESRFGYSALSFSYAIAATLTAFVPTITLLIAQATDSVWWHPGIVLATLSIVTLVSAIAAARMPKPQS
jgi:hypothetical protein